MPEGHASIRYLGLSSVRVTESAALASAKMIGCGDERKADEAAVAAMIDALNELDIDGTVRIGTDESQETMSLKPGTKVGIGKHQKVDVALMPVEGPSIVARGAPNGMSIIAMTEPGGFLHPPDIYMEKIAVGEGLPEDVVSLDETPEKNLTALAKAKGRSVSEIIACILDRPRNSELIKQVRAAGARVLLISDGDVSGAMATIWPGSQIDILMGIGSAPQGVLAAAALSSMGGQMQCRFVFRDQEDRKLVEKSDIGDPDKIFNTQELASGDITFAATGVTNGHILSGVGLRHGVPTTQSIVMRRSTGILRVIESFHGFAERPHLRRNHSGD
ncbi:MAG: class II fructose-bisphosphatase [Rhodospirillales bacterium]